MLTFYIRPARPTDAPAISTLILAGSEESVGHEGTQDEIDNWRNSIANTNVVNRRMQEPMMKVMVAEGNAHHIPIGLLGTGFATINDMGEGYIGGIYTGVKNRQVEHKIMQSLIQWLKSQKAHSINMSISHANFGLKKLAEDFGFTIQGTESGAYFLNGKFEIWSVAMTNIHEFISDNPDT